MGSSNKILCSSSHRLVKDNRTNFESTNPDKVLDGGIDDFLESSLYKTK
jgi:peptide chain release factor 2